MAGLFLATNADARVWVGGDLLGVVYAEGSLEQVTTWGEIASDATLDADTIGAITENDRSTFVERPSGPAGQDRQPA